MKRAFFALLAVILLAGCSEDKLKVIHNNDRVTELERRAALNDQLNSLQNQRLDALEAALQAESNARAAADLALSADLQAEMDARITADQDLAGLVSAEEAARIAGDDDLRSELQLEIANRIAGDNANSTALGISVFTQTLINIAVQGQLSLVNGKISMINGKITNLTARVNNLEDDVDDLEDAVHQLGLDMETLRLNLQAQIDDVSAAQVATQAQLDQEGVKVYKCNSPSSTERILKINNTFYAVMNRVTTESVQVVTGSTSTTFTNPILCVKGGKAKLPGGNGQCPSSWVTVGGDSVTVPSYSTAPKTVVTSVKMALDPLADGSYVTTDGGPACSFSVNNGVSTNLIQAQ